MNRKASHTPPTSRAKRQTLAAILRAHPGTICAARRDCVREALSQFATTTCEPMRAADVCGPPARVMQLRNGDERIEFHWQIGTTESGTHHRVELYLLQPTKDEATTPQMTSTVSKAVR